jgi:hypothetical protein
MKETNVYAVKFKGQEGVGYICGETEEKASRRCKRYSAPLKSIEFDHVLVVKKKKKVENR